jgi:alpha-N-acetylglucosamine transferase
MLTPGRYKFLIYVGLLTLLSVLVALLTPSHHIPICARISTYTPTASEIQWSDYAYFLYATDPTYLCNAVMLLDSLHQVASKAGSVLIYPREWDIDGGDDVRTLLRAATEVYGAKTVPVELQIDYEETAEVDRTWARSYTKLLAFNKTQYKRVISLDSDASVLQVNRSRATDEGDLSPLP